MNNFGWAIEKLKEGHKVTRNGWNGKDMFLTMSGGYSVDVENCQDAGNINKEFLKSRNLDKLVIQSHIDMWTAQNTLCVGWLASQGDMLANDWRFADGN